MSYFHFLFKIWLSKSCVEKFLKYNSLFNIFSTRYFIGGKFQPSFCLLQRSSCQSLKHFTFVNYDSRVVIAYIYVSSVLIYARRGFIRLATGQVLWTVGECNRRNIRAQRLCTSTNGGWNPSTLFQTKLRQEPILLNFCFTFCLLHSGKPQRLLRRRRAHRPTDRPTSQIFRLTNTDNSGLETRTNATAPKPETIFSGSSFCRLRPPLSLKESVT